MSRFAISTCIICNETVTYTNNRVRDSDGVPAQDSTGEIEILN